MKEDWPQVIIVETGYEFGEVLYAIFSTFVHV